MTKFDINFYHFKKQGIRTVNGFEYKMKLTYALFLLLTLNHNFGPSNGGGQTSKPSFLDVFLKWKLEALEDDMEARLRLRDQLMKLEKQKQRGLKHNFIDTVASKDAQDAMTHLRYQVNLDSEGNMQLSWDVNPTNEKIVFQLKARAHWADVVGFGFSDYGGCCDADFLILWTDVDGNHYFTDTHTNHQGYAEVDTSQDYDLIDIHINGGYINLTFSRKFDTCDDDDYVIDAGTTHILFFTLNQQLEDLPHLNVRQLHPGLQRVQLLKSQIADEPLPDDTKTFVMHVENVALPVQETTYWCYVRKLPQMTSKHHIIKFEGVVSEAGQGIVHHMEVFHCDGPANTPVRDYNAPCQVMGAERPKGLESCRQVIGAWALGATPMSYPAEAGYSVGGENFSPYVMIEVHYNNPGLRSGVVDSSGIKFYVTEQLRHYDAGIMELGMEYTDKYALPPGLSLWHLHGYCIPECTQAGLGEDGIQVFASQLHTHLTGKRAYTKHYRDGNELPDLNRDNHYSPHYQEIRKLHRQVTVLPGDTLVTTCEDSTLDRENVTLGGFSISDEMCVNYIHYYPKVDLEVCKSSVTTASLYGFFNFLKQYQWEKTSPQKGIADNYKSIEWKPMNIELLKTYYDIAPLSMQCNKSDGSRFPGVNWEDKTIPELHPLPEEERPCLV